MSYNMLSGMTQHFYHTVPSNLDNITTSPTREGIYKNLSQIEYHKFPEFILDILVKVEGHTAVDVTDGQGDEKQDILTINPNGERCLTQCKHTVNYKDHYNGDNLDLMVTACMRKDCKQAIFVTNSDLTPQGKKYVTDKEYNRSFKNSENHLDIDYWNGYKIWERIKNNPDILNKWFGNLGQVSGLRSFRFDLTIQKMPYNSTENLDDTSAFQSLIETIKAKPWIKEIEADQLYEAAISENYDVTIKRWIQYTGGLDINFTPPTDNLDFIDKAIYALTIDVKVKVDKPFSPNSIRSEIVKKIGDEILPIATEESLWWHLTSSQIKSFIYLHDIKEPREIDLTSATTFVRTSHSATISEYDYCADFKDKFKVIEADDDYILVHKTTDIQLIPYFEQRINPVTQYNHQLIQYNNLKKIADYDFYAVKDIASSMIMRLRKMLRPEWTAFTHNDTSVIWAVDPNLDAQQVIHVHTKIEAVGLKVLLVQKEDISTILENVQKDLIPGHWMYISNVADLSFPINLDRRMTILSKGFKCKSFSDRKKIQLMEYKYQYEHTYGFDNMHGKETETINSRELQGILFDLFTFRGERMLDIGFDGQQIIAYLRFKDTRLEPAAILSQFYVKEFKDVFTRLKKIMAS